MSWIGPLLSALVGGVTGNIANKSAIQNQQNAMNNALSQEGQGQQKAQAGLNAFAQNSPFNKIAAPTAPQAVTAQSSPTLPVPGQPGQGQPGQGGAPGGQGGIPPQLLQALMAAKQGGGQPGMQRPQLSQGNPNVSAQQLTPRLYGQG
jgi:hypothetical protein